MQNKVLILRKVVFAFVNHSKSLWEIEQGFDNCFIKFRVQNYEKSNIIISGIS